MNICIKADNLTKRYNDKVVVDALSFEVKKGEVFGLLGHNGAGKSTTINCLLGLVKQTSGSSTILGMEAKHNRKQLFERVGVQLQQSHFQDNIKVKEVCEERAVLYKNALNYQTLLKQFRLDSFLHQKVSNLSGGELQKLSVVLALIPDPEVVFLDELTTGLDVAARREVWNILKELKEKGLTIFLTTHYMEEAMHLCDHIVILKGGKNVIEGSVQEVIEKSPYHTLEEAYLWYTDEEEFV